MTTEIPVCVCGSKMIEAHNDNYFICDNCDIPQAIQSTVVDIVDGVRVYGERVKTERDKKFDATMKSRINQWFD